MGNRSWHAASNVDALVSRLQNESEQYMTLLHEPTDEQRSKTQMTQVARNGAFVNILCIHMHDDRIGILVWRILPSSGYPITYTTITRLDLATTRNLVPVVILSHLNELHAMTGPTMREFHRSPSIAISYSQTR